MKVSHPRTRPAYRALIEVVRASGLIAKAGDRVLGRHGLTQTQFNVLMVLRYDLPRGASQTELSRNLLVNPADMSGLIRRMLAKGILLREDHPRDARAWSVSLSPKGRDLLSQLEPSYYSQVEHLMGTRSERELEGFREILQSLETGLLSLEAA